MRGRFDTVERSGAADYGEDKLIEVDRQGFLEETYITYSYSPLRDGDDRVAGILCTTTETTERVLAQRRLDTLSALATAAT